MSKKKDAAPDGKQKSLLGFFTKKDMAAPAPARQTLKAPVPAKEPVQKPPTPPLTGKKSSDPISLDSSPARPAARSEAARGLPTPPATDEGDLMSVDSKVPELEDEEDEAISQPKASKKRRVIAETESESEEPARKTAPVKRPRTSSVSKSTQRDEDDFINDEDEEMSEANTHNSTSPAPVAAKTKPKANGTTKAKASSSKASSLKAPELKRNPSSSSSTSFMKTNAQQQKEAKQQARREQEVSFKFLHPDHIRDADRKRPNDPDYDPRTLYIPDKEYQHLTPFERQFWDIKKSHMDVVLFFQKGKFYELYEEDASIGHREFDLKLTDRVKMRMVGVPEGQFPLWSSKFLARGHRVGRVDQVETAIGMEMRQRDTKAKPAKGKGKDKEEKIVIRQLRSVVTAGTQTENLTDDLSKHCLAIVEQAEPGHDNPSIGACILDASTACFKLTAFVDDPARTKLETLIRQSRASELIHIKHNLSATTIRVLRSALPTDCQWIAIKSIVPADAIDGLNELLAETRGESDGQMATDEKEELPAAVAKMQDNVEAISALGGVLRYLKEVNLDTELVTARRFEIWDPMRDGQRLVLDGQTLAHIEVLQNSHGGEEGTLLRLLSRCITPFGKRLFKLWLCQPLRSVTGINERLDAVEDLMNNVEFGAAFDTAAKGTPDLERLVSRIHAGSCKPRDFVKVLEAFKNIHRLIENLSDVAKPFKSTIIARLLESAPDLASLVKEVDETFEATSDGDLIPLPGADQEYDDAMAAVEDIEEVLKKLLKQYRRDLDDSSIIYRDIGTKDIYQIQCPTKLKVPKNWTQMTTTKEFRRYYSPEVEKNVRALKEARETKVAAIASFKGRLYAHFDEHSRSWLRAVEIVSQLDCLLSLAKSSSALSEPCVRPEIVEADTAFVHFDELRHPCVFSATSDFIPNDVSLGGEQRSMILLTGPNMAGKSTLLRMTSAAVIMAQLGCFVPAAKARISPCDRITTRMGANDHIFANASTFKVEMDDCKKILSEATPRSLVILDELGRGTSTWDGMAIAYSVLHHLSTHIGCIGFFATHYSSLTQDVAYHPQIRPAHMATLVEGDDAHEVTFLYKLQDGATTKSYGPSVARMAGLNENIVRRAMVISKDLETKSKERIAASATQIGFSLPHQADLSWLMHMLVKAPPERDPAQLARTLDIVRTSLTQ